MTTEEWEKCWGNFLEKKKLRNIIKELDEADGLDGRQGFTKQICYEVYCHYDDIKEGLETVKRDLIDSFGQLEYLEGNLGGDFFL